MSDSQKNLQFICALTGAASVVTGTCLWHVSAGLVVAGVFLLAWAFVPRR